MGDMRKLNRRKVRWLIRAIEKRELSMRKIARQQGITPRWLRELYREYKRTGEYSYPRPSGRKVRGIPEPQRQEVIALYKEHPLCACMLERILDERGIHLPHNRIHGILRDAGIARKEPKKSKRRRWIRYERRHSNSLWHTDWFKAPDGHLNIMEDDASRFITGYGVFDRESSGNAATVFLLSSLAFKAPKQLMSDHGSSFYSLQRDGCAKHKPTAFQTTIHDTGTKHVLAGIKHPQTNGKVERVVQTLRKLKKHFGTWDGALYYYNYLRPHMSLSSNSLRTPYQAFIDKQRQKRI